MNGRLDKVAMTNRLMQLKRELHYKCEISEMGKEVLEFSPEIRIYNQPVMTTSEADIKTNLISDNFLVFSLIKDEEIFNVRYQYKPFMVWIWLSTIILAIGGSLAVVRK